MQELSAPKMRPEKGEGAGSFCSLRERAEAFLREGAGKRLIVSDEKSFGRIAFAVRSPRAVSAVLGRDALPLFGLPEAAGVLAVGGADVMRAARLYAAVRRAPCVLFPTESELFGVFGQEEVRLKGGMYRLPLAEGEVCFDEALFSDAAEGYAGLLLSRLSLFERRALAVLGEDLPAEEEAFGILMDIGELRLREIVSKNAALRRMGFQKGEGAVLAERVGSFAAFESLMKLYVAFFRCGSPQKYTAVDYERRAREAGVPYSSLKIPTEEVFARRALALGGRRAELLRELSLISKGEGVCRRTYRALGGRIVPFDLAPLKTLPERAGGLSAVIRDFALMEKL